MKGLILSVLVLGLMVEQASVMLTEMQDDNMSMTFVSSQVVVDREGDADKIYKIELTEVVTSELPVDLLGEFTINAYCSCGICKAGVIGEKKMTPYEGITVAVNAGEIAYGSMIVIEGVGIRLAQQNNRKVEEGVIEVFVKDHVDVENFQIGRRRVYTFADLS